nr:MAG TPA: hypothetical protein [Caudoviricetes sp.]
MNERRSNHYHSSGACCGGSRAVRVMDRTKGRACEIRGRGRQAPCGAERQDRRGEKPRAGECAQGVRHTNGVDCSAASGRNKQIKE